MRRPTRLAVLGLVAFLGFAWGTTSFGCPVCFGETDSPIVQGVQMSVLFMIGITYSLLFSGVAAVIVLRRRALRKNGTLELPKNERAISALSLE